MKTSAKYIKYSSSESRITGLKTGRIGLIEFLNEKELSMEIVKERYDLIKMKICAEDAFLFEKLHSFNFPFHIYNIQVRNVKEINAGDRNLVEEPGIKYEVIVDRHKGILRKFVKETIMEDSGLNYYSGLYSKLVPSEIRLNATIEYVLSFIYPNNENKIGWLMKIKNQYAGFCICSFEKKNMEGLLYGISKQFLRKGYSRNLIKVVKKFCHDNNIKTLSDNVVIQNIKSLKSMANEGVLPQKIYFNIFLFPLLSMKSQKEMGGNSAGGNNYSMDNLC